MQNGDDSLQLKFWKIAKSCWFSQEKWKARTGIGDRYSAILTSSQIADESAFLLFSAGVIGTDLLATPVRGDSSAYVMGQSLQMAQQPGTHAVPTD
ncbi:MULTISPECIES: hypothetical protein [Cupriavidus]